MAPVACDRASMSIARRHIGLFNFASSASAVGICGPRRVDARVEHSAQIEIGSAGSATHRRNLEGRNALRRADPVGSCQYIVGDGCARGHAPLDLDNRDLGHVKKSTINVNSDTSAPGAKSQRYEQRHRPGALAAGIFGPCAAACSIHRPTRNCADADTVHEAGRSARRLRAPRRSRSTASRRSSTWPARGPAVIVMTEMPGISPHVARFAPLGARRRLHRVHAVAVRPRRRRARRARRAAGALPARAASAPSSAPSPRTSRAR